MKRRRVTSKRSNKQVARRLARRRGYRKTVLGYGGRVTGIKASED